MNTKKIILKLLIIVFIILALTFIITLWKNPKHIAKTVGTIYFIIRCPKMHLLCVGMEWSEYHDDYIIYFTDKAHNKGYSCTIGPKYFPVILGQGKDAIIEYYDEIFLPELEKENSIK